MATFFHYDDQDVLLRHVKMKKILNKYFLETRGNRLKQANVI